MLTDRQASIASPLQQVDHIGMPGLECSSCHNTWAGSRRLYLPVDDPALAKRLKNTWPIPTAEWLALAIVVRKSLGLPSDFLLRPGDGFGIPVFELRSSRLSDIMHPFPGQTIVTEEVAESLRASDLTGYRLIECHTRWSAAMKRKLPPDQAAPPLFELAVEGKAWRKGKFPMDAIDCQQCGRANFPDPSYLEIDLERYDASDFFHTDLNPNRVMVTERVCTFLAEHDFQNYLCAKKLTRMSGYNP